MAAPGDYLMQAVLHANQQRNQAYQAGITSGTKKYVADQAAAASARKDKLAREKWEFAKKLTEEENARLAQARELDVYATEVHYEGEISQQKEDLAVESLETGEQTADQYSTFGGKVKEWWRDEGWLGPKKGEPGRDSAYDLHKYPGLTIAGEKVKQDPPQIDPAKLKGMSSSDYLRLMPLFQTSRGESEGSSTNQLLEDIRINSLYDWGNNYNDPNYKGKP